MRWVGYALCWLGLILVTLYAILNATTNWQAITFALYVAALWLAGWALWPERVR